MHLRLFVSYIILSLRLSAAEIGEPTPVNQLLVSGNACGPAALLNAFRFGNSDWQRASNSVTCTNDKELILKVIREIGMRPSKHIAGRPRWSRRGVSVADLRDMADEMTIGQFLPHPSDEVFFLQPRETPEKLLIRVHQRLTKSITKGLPPIISLRRYTLRSQPNGQAQWVVVDAHFVTLTQIPTKLEKKTQRFPVTYIDPWGGRYCHGEIAIPNPPFLADPSGNPSCLEAEFPKSSVGNKLVRKSEKSFIAVSAAIGRW